MGKGSPANVSCLDLTWDDESRASRSTKRPRTENSSSPTVNVQMVTGKTTTAPQKVCSLIRKLDKTVDKLKKEVEANRNTKVEIKEMTQHIVSIMSQINTDEIQKMLQPRDTGETIITPIERPRGISKDVGTQVNLEDTDIESIIRREKIAATLNEEPDDEQIREVISHKWEEEFFSKTKIERNDLPVEQEVLIIVNKEKHQRDISSMNKVLKKFPEVGEVLEDASLESQTLVTCVSKSGRISDDGTVKYANEKYIHVIAEEPWHDTETDRHKIRAAIQRVGAMARNRKQQEVGCVVEDLRYVDIIRKLAELAYQKEGPILTIYGRKKLRNRSRVESNADSVELGWTQVKRTRSETVVVKPTGNISYAEVILSMKKNVETQDIRIDSITKSDKGEVILKVNGSEKASRERFQEELKEKMKDIAQDTRRQKKQTILLIDLDTTVTTNEIKTVLTDELERESLTGGEFDIKIANRTSEAGTKIAFVSVGVEEAMILLEKRRVGTGWLRWRVRELITPRKCIKCRRVGHEADTCKEKATNKACYNCGNTDHVAKDCKEDSRCYLCEEIGHRAETMRCPVYRELVNRMREARIHANANDDK